MIVSSALITGRPGRNHIAARQSLMAGAWIAGGALMCPLLHPKRHTIHNSAETKRRMANLPAQI